MELPIRLVDESMNLRRTVSLHYIVLLMCGWALHYFVFWTCSAWSYDWLSCVCWLRSNDCCWMRNEVEFVHRNCPSRSRRIRALVGGLIKMNHAHNKHVFIVRTKVGGLRQTEIIILRIQQIPSRKKGPLKVMHKS